MCTAIVYRGQNSYIGRNLDLEYRYDEKIVIIPRNLTLDFKLIPPINRHYAIVGTATFIDGMPLYYDAINEAGVGIVALNFVGNAHYTEKKSGAINLAPYEIIPYILAYADNIDSAVKKIEKINIVDMPFNESTQNPQLHWLISDREKSIVLECVKEGIKIYDNPFDVLTNNPTFDYHLNNINNYINITSEEPHNRFSQKAKMCLYSKGMGGIGLPGDYSSSSRLVKAAFVNLNSPVISQECESVNQVFHILKSVEMPLGSVKNEDGYEITQYTSCYNLDKGIYYYTTYNNSQICAIDLRCENLDAREYISYTMSYESDIKYVN